MILAEPSPPLRQYLRFARRQSWLIALVPTLAVATTAFSVQRQASVYRASMAIVVAESGARPPLGNPALMQTMKSILKSNVVARRVVRQLGLPISSAELSKKIRVEYQPDSSALNVSYDSKDKREALSVVSQVGVAFQSVAHERLGVSTSLQRPGPLLIVANVLDPPHLEAGRVSPRPKQTLGFAGILGLALGLILAFVRESLDDRIRSRGEAEEAFGAPVIGALPRRFSARPSTKGHAQPRQEAEEALQTLCANLEATAQGKTRSTFLVTSALDSDKPANVVANLAVALARDGHDVLCIDADVRRPILDRLLGVSARTHGLLSVVEDGMPAENALEEVELAGPSKNGPADAARDKPGGRLLLLPAAARPADGTAVISSQRLLEIVVQLSARSRYTLIHSPGLLSDMSGAASIAADVDSVLVVARQGRTRREWAEKVRLTLKALGTRKIALILTDVRNPLSTIGD
jgi:capsular polysaccharide biosynthesis protein/Mrp family chromosome partitioning ATPase